MSNRAIAGVLLLLLARGAVLSVAEVLLIPAGVVVSAGEAGDGRPRRGVALPRLGTGAVDRRMAPRGGRRGLRILGILEMIRGVVRLITSAAPTARADDDVTLLTISAIVTILVGAAVVVVAFGTFNGNNGPRVALGLVLVRLVGDALLALVYYPGELVLAIIVGVIAIASLIALFTPRATANSCSPSRRPAAEPTPSSVVVRAARRRA